MVYPRRRRRAGEDVFPRYLRHARKLLTSLPAQLPSGRTGLSLEFEALRWFPLPLACLSHEPGEPEVTPAG